MRLLVATLCDFAEIREGLLTIVSAGITRLWRDNDQAPTSMAAFLAIQVEIDQSERPFPHELKVAISGPSGAEVARINVAMQVGPVPVGTFDADEGALFSLPLDLRSIGIVEFGWHKIEITVDSAPLQTLRVKVARRPAAATPPGAPVSTPGAQPKQPH